MTSKGLAVLGVSVGDRPGAALLLGGRLVAASDEEQAAGFPVAAVRHCLQQAGIGPAELDFVALDTAPRAAFHAALIASRAGGFAAYLEALQPWMASGLHLRRQVVAALGGGYRGPIALIDRTEALAAASSYRSAADEAAARVIWHGVLAYPRLAGAPGGARQTVRSRAGSAAAIPAPIAWLIGAALAAAYPLLLFGRGLHARPGDVSRKRGSEYFVDTFGPGSPGAAARFLTTCAAAIARLRGLTQAARRPRPAGAEIPDEIYTLW